jgi:D-glycero-D-manno-heptose 1,7-bisphosphate phosphatase
VQTRAVFLDRDGTLVRDRGFVHRVEDLELLAGAVDGLREMAALGWRVFITTNQSGIARGYFSEDAMHAFNRALCERLATHGIEIAGIYFCPFHPTEGVGEYRRDSPLRKPAPGMIQQAAREHAIDLAASFAIGDKAADVLAGRAAGCRTILIAPANCGSASEPDFVAGDLAQAASCIRAGSADGN